jgi:toxin YoeB
MEVALMPTALEDVEFWRQSGSAKIQERISTLLRATAQHPFEGVGKPERLKHGLSGYWSRRINAEHRLVYTLISGTVYVIACRYRYGEDLRSSSIKQPVKTVKT